MVRAAIGREPLNRNDGYLVYYGESNYTIDWVNMETLSEPIYYKAWSQNVSGLWEEAGSNSDFVRGVGMLMLGFIFLCLGLTISSYVLRKGVLAYAGAGAWMILGTYSYTQSAGGWDIYMALFWLCMAMLLASVLEPVAMRTKAEEIVDEEVEVDEAMAELKAMQSYLDNVVSLPRRRSRR